MHIKLKGTPGIYLVGFMACGKTTVGGLLAERLGWEFIDLDTVIERQAGQAIREIFAKRGEEDFRRLETYALHAAVGQVRLGLPRVVALGGGAFTREENVYLIEDHGVSIWLDCPLDVARGRVQENADRPLARDLARFEALYAQRKDLYAKANHSVPVAGKQPPEIVQEICSLLRL
jgi:shikimate kinase